MQNNDDYLFLDLGSGIANFKLYEEIAKCKKIKVLLSHYHLDHIIGIIYLLNICRDKEIYIWGPGKDIYGVSCHEILQKIISPPYFGRNIDDFSFLVEINDYQIGYNSFSPNFEVDIIPQIHSSPSFGMLVNNMIYYATDTIVTEETFKKASSAKLLLHECWEIENSKNEKHSSLSEIIEMTNKYQIQNVKLIHLNPNWSENDYSIAEKLIANTNIMFASDGDKYII